MNRNRSGSVLVGLLWCVAVLSVVVIGVLHGSTLDLRIAKNHGDRIQAHYLALAGIEKAKALLHQDLKDRQSRDQNHTGALFEDEDAFRDVELGRGVFRLIKQGGSDSGGSIRYGLTDEESRLNVNYATADEMIKLPDLRPEPAAAIVDYRDRDNEVTQGGAEAEQYAALQPPMVPLNAPLRSDRELLRVYGMDGAALLGEDVNFNGLLDPEENDGENSPPDDNANGRLDAGWSAWITTKSSNSDVDARGEDRVNIQEAPENELQQLDGITADIARAIVQYRGQNEFESIAHLLDVRAAQQQQGGSAGGGQQPPQGNPNAGAQRGNNNPGGGGGGGGNFTGPALIDEQLFIRIADRITVRETRTHAGPVNINTAPSRVLECLPDVTPEIADAIIRHRSSVGWFANVGELLKVDGFNADLLKRVAPRVTARSETFRILGEGEVTSTGARKRIQVIVRPGPSSVETLFYREDL